MMETLIQDLRYGIRMLASKPGFTVVAVLALALGIGANTAIFSIFDAVLLRPLPYKQPGGIVQFWETNPLKGWTAATVAPANFLDWQKQSQSFEEMAAYMGSQSRDAGLSNFYLTGNGEAERLQGLTVTGNLFSVLGVEAALGRALLPEETEQGKHLVVVLSHNLWQRRFGADPDIIGKTISLNGRDRLVVGVMPARFYFPNKEAELWVPMGWDTNQMASLRRPHFLRAIARLKPGVSLEQARAEMISIATALEQQYPDTNTQMSVGLGPLHEWIVEDTRLALLVFFAAVGFVLLIACANVANLLLARAASRQKEIAIRTALGAGRLRIIRQLLTESLLLALAGGGLGLLLAVWCKDLLLAFSPGNIPRFDEITLDGRVLGFTLAITVLTALVFGLLPALQTSKPDLTSSLKEGQKGAGGSQGKSARSVLVVAEIALSLVLVIGAGLMIKSFLVLQRVDPLVDPENLLTLRLSLPGAKYSEDHQRTAFFRQVEERIGGLPGVEGVGASTRIALRGYNWTGDLTVEGHPPDQYFREVRHKEITPNYFRAMRISLLSGREFSEADTAESTAVIIVNRALAQKYFSDEDPIGRRVKFTKPEHTGMWHTIIGIVEGEKQDGLGVEIKPEVYQSHLQSPQSDMTFVVRTAIDPTRLIEAVRGEIRAVDKDLPAFDIKPMNEVLSASFARERFTMLLLAIFAGVALILAAVGIYGVMSYSVTQRTHEIGIRMALGAQHKDVIRLVVGQAVMLAGIGVGTGLAAAFALTRLMSSLLYGVSATDPATFALVSLLLTGVAFAASYVPARRAMKVDPMIALRHE